MPKGVTLFVGYPAVSVCMVSYTVLIYITIHHNKSIKWLVGSNYTFDISMDIIYTWHGMRPLYIFLLVAYMVKSC